MKLKSLFLLAIILVAAQAWGFGWGSGGVYPAVDQSVRDAKLRKPGNVLTKSLNGRFDWMSLSSQAHTTHIETVTEDPFDAVRIIIPGSGTVKAVTVKAMVGVRSTLGADNSTDSITATTWAPVTFGNNTTVVIPARTSSVKFGWTAVSDWVPISSLDRTDGGTLPVLMVRVQVPFSSGNSTIPSSHYTDTTGWETEANVGGRVWRARTQAVLGGSVATASSFTSTASAGLHIPVIIQYASRYNGMTVMGIGDSITAGYTANPDAYGWGPKAVQAVSTPTFPVEWCNMGIGSALIQDYFTSLSDTVSIINPDVITYAAYSPNIVGPPPLTTAAINYAEYYFARARQLARDNGAVIVPWTGLPTSSSVKNYQASDSYRVGYNSLLKTIASTNEMLLVDAAPVVSDVTDQYGQINMLANLTADGIHPNDTGYTGIANLWIPVLKNIIKKR